ncbi:hypothetical protein BSLG_006640 [Batrachochytrium salamandrivorans]|nr:hypothetical protein BSLG_006640 [Batrachochytrium salamandrivorans]
MIGLLAAVTLLASSGASAYSLCDTAKYPYAGQSVSATILKTTTTAFGSTPITITGTVSVVDGCNVFLRSLSMEALAMVLKLSNLSLRPSMRHRRPLLKPTPSSQLLVATLASMTLVSSVSLMKPITC